MARGALSNHLQADYANFKEVHQDNEKTARQLVIKKIRCVLVKNPFDYVGRKMAKEAKNVFLSNVLQETNFFHRVKDKITIPYWICKRQWVKWVFAFLPFLIAFCSMNQQMIVYILDFCSDVRVITELENDHDNFRLPDLRSLPNFDNDVQNWSLTKLNDRGIRGIEKPCEVIDLLENLVFKEIPIMKMLDISVSPIRNATFHFTDAFRVVDKALDIYTEYTSKTGGLEEIKGPADIPRMMKIAKTEIKKGSAQLSGLLVNLFGGAGAQNAKSLLVDLEELLDKINSTIIEDPLVKRMILEGEQQLQSYPIVQNLKAFSKEIFKNLKPEDIAEFEYNPEPDPFQNTMNSSQKICRKYIVKSIQLQKNPDIKKAIWGHFANKSKYLTKIIDGFKGRLLFMTKYVMKSVLIYLSLSLIYTVAYEAKNILNEIVSFGLWPLKTNFNLIVQENNPNSSNFNRQNGSNEYVVQVANRHSLNINEATKETLSAVNIQIALYVYMVTFLAIYRKLVDGLTSQDIPDSMFGLTDHPFTEFWNSAIMKSLIMGIISLTFAQYKQYATRHGGDMEMCGKAVYFLACLFNSFSIFTTQTIFYATGINFLLLLLCVLIKHTVGFDAYDDFPNSNRYFIYFLVIVFVLLPLKFIPIMFAKWLKMMTEKYVLHKTFHLNERNRSGYDVSGYDTAF